MTGVVILTSEEARRRVRALTDRREITWCSCDIGSVCTCGNEAPVTRSTSAAGWRVAR